MTAAASKEPTSQLSSIVSIELEHSIGFSIQCQHPLHYISKSGKQTTLAVVPVSDQHSNSNSGSSADKKNVDYDYISVCGSSIILQKFNDPHAQAFLRSHIHNISCCVVSPDKQRIASAELGPNPDIYIWDIPTQQAIYKFEEHQKGVATMAFSDDSRFLATVGGITDNKMYIWDMTTGYIVTSSGIKPNPCCDIAWGGRVKDVKKRLTTDYLFATCGEKEVRIWAMTPSTGHLLSETCKTLNLHRSFTCLTFSPSGDLLIAGTTSGDFFIVDVRQLSALAKYDTGVGGISGVICIPMVAPVIHDTLNAHFFVRIYASTGDGSVSYWEYNDDLQKFLQYQKVSAFDGPITCMSMDADVGVGNQNCNSNSNSNSNNNQKGNILIGTAKGLIYECTRDLLSSNQSTVIEIKASNETSSIIDVQYPRCNSISHQFLTVSKIGSIRKWNSNKYNIELSHAGVHMHGHLAANCFDFNEEIVILGWNDGEIRSYNYNKSDDYLWSIKDAHRAQSGGVSCVKLSFNEKYIVSAGVDGELRVWDIRFRKLVSHLKEHTAEINAIALYDDNRHALTCSRDRSLICWDFQEQKRLSCHRQHMGAMNDVILSKDQQTVVTVGGNRAITLWDLRQTTPVHCINNAHNGELTCMDLSNDSSMLVTAGTDNCIKLWDFKQYQLMTQQKACCGRINGLAFSGDDKQIVSVGSDASIMLWNVYKM